MFTESDSRREGQRLAGASSARGRRWLRASPSEEGAHPRNDLVELGVTQFGEDRQGEDLARGPLALGALPRAVAQVGEARLEVERQRIVDRGADATRLEERLQLVPAGH